MSCLYMQVWFWRAAIRDRYAELIGAKEIEQLWVMGGEPWAIR